WSAVHAPPCGHNTQSVELDTDGISTYCRRLPIGPRPPITLISLICRQIGYLREMHIRALPVERHSPIGMAASTAVPSFVIYLHNSHLLGAECSHSNRVRPMCSGESIHSGGVVRTVVTRIGTNVCASETVLR